IALWEQRKVVIAMGSALWLANATAYVYGAFTLRGDKIDGAGMFIHLSHSNIIILSTFFTDLVLLSLMFAGLLRWRNSRRRGGIWWTLYTQGLAWVVVFTLAGLPSVIFVMLNLNGMHLFEPLQHHVLMVIFFGRSYSSGMYNSLARECDACLIVISTVMLQMFLVPEGEWT
ncbi:hypothetical protein BC827DRAFT_1163984, partial [Russula dissimulans]